MKAAEAAALLTIAAAYDNRKPDPDQARAWAMVLDGYRFEDCREAIVTHYRTSRDWMMPADVIAGAKRIRQQRVRAYGALPPPPRHIDPDDTRALQQWEIETTRRIADGELTADNPQMPALAAAEASARVREIRAGLAKRAPEPERTTLADLVPDDDGEPA